MTSFKFSDAGRRQSTSARGPRRNRRRAMSVLNVRQLLTSSTDTVEELANECADSPRLALTEKQQAEDGPDQDDRQ